MAIGTERLGVSEVLEGEYAALEQLAAVPPALIHEQAELLRYKSRECADVAGNCVTEEAKIVLQDMAQDYQRKADRLDRSLSVIRRLYTEAFDAGIPGSQDEPASP